jgi:hypothetical protein
MSLQNLDNLVKRGLLQQEPAHKDEVGRLLSAADASLADSKVHAVSVASRFAIAYQAALGYSLIALRVRGYRTSSHQPGQHSIAIQSLPLTIAFAQSHTNTLDAFKEKRHRGAYEGILTTSEKEVTELQGLATKLRASVLIWMTANRPDLL